jgi:hypothetical protein
VNGDYQRKSDLELTALSQKFSDFVERYDRDVGALSEWRRMKDAEIIEHAKVLSEISPAYARGKWVAMLVAVGSVGLAVKTFWSHISFK